MVEIDAYVSKLQNAGLKVEEIADILGVKESQVATYRQGRVQFPRLQVAVEVYLYNHDIIYPYSKEAILKYIKENK